MAIYWNGSSKSKVYFNGTEMTNVYFNGTLIHQSVTKEWVFINEVSSDPGNSTAEAQGDASGWASAQADLEYAEPAATFNVGDSGEYYSTSTGTYFVFECQEV